MQFCATELRYFRMLLYKRTQETFSGDNLNPSLFSFLIEIQPSLLPNENFPQLSLLYYKHLMYVFQQTRMRFFFKNLTHYT